MPGFDQPLTYIELRWFLNGLICLGCIGDEDEEGSVAVVEEDSHRVEATEVVIEAAVGAMRHIEKRYPTVECQYCMITRTEGRGSG